MLQSLVNYYGLLENRRAQFFAPFWQYTMLSCVINSRAPVKGHLDAVPLAMSSSLSHKRRYHTEINTQLLRVSITYVTTPHNRGSSLTACRIKVTPMQPRFISPHVSVTSNIILSFSFPSLNSIVYIGCGCPVQTLVTMPLEARVKSVLSGDTLVLSHVTNPSQERILSLAYVSAPRLRREGDEVSTRCLDQ